MADRGADRLLDRRRDLRAARGGDGRDLTGSGLGSQIALEELEREPHRLLAQLREHEPVSWVSALGGWLITRYDLALQAMRDAATFTVDHPRFSTAQVVGPSMLSLDGEQHARHRACFAGAFRPLAVRERFPAIVAAEARRLVDSLEPQGAAELRRSYAGPLAAATITSALGLRPDEASAVLGWYDAIVRAVTEVTEGGEVPRSGRDAFEQLRARLIEVVDTHPGLDRDEVVSNAAVLLFGGIETMEGMIANAVLAILEHEAAHDLERAIEESLRLEPAAAMVDRYATRDVELGGSQIRRGELVHISITAANRDPAVFADPDVFDPRRENVRRHLAFAHGLHVCLGVHLARLEAQLALATLLRHLPALRLDRERPSAVRGLVFRKPPELHVRWD